MINASQLGDVNSYEVRVSQIGPSQLSNIVVCSRFRRGEKSNGGVGLVRVARESIFHLSYQECIVPCIMQNA